MTFGPVSHREYWQDVRNLPDPKQVAQQLLNLLSLLSRLHPLRTHSLAPHRHVPFLPLHRHLYLPMLILRSTMGVLAPMSLTLCGR